MPDASPITLLGFEGIKYLIWISVICWLIIESRRNKAKEKQDAKKEENTDARRTTKEGSAS